VSKTSRSRFARLAGWNTPDAAELFNVLRLVLCTQPRSNLGAVRECARANRKSKISNHSGGMTQCPSIMLALTSPA
jgi:hypothetical protein